MCQGGEHLLYRQRPEMQFENLFYRKFPSVELVHAKAINDKM